ncbi:hypothetical protein LOAG_14586 [Loa loa]|uniref:Uncharacterized protein n=1 Tax=Loa loa TaxID=7209 RepID=A0A1S0THI5_LOALO|nr:hypothetical protein LOAG_14586 [Loa loa]EFO13940.1 hypothetical protein LOAG_14586 [Loa loa]
MFVIEPLQNAIINANFTDGMRVDEIVINEYSISEEHCYPTILKAIKSIFAHLLDSEMQFYFLKFFWKHFCSSIRVFCEGKQEQKLRNLLFSFPEVPFYIFWRIRSARSVRITLVN